MTTQPARLRLDVRGIVQGVGFRPHAYRLARELGLAGWIQNDGDGVRIELEGTPSRLDLFSARLVAEAPQAAAVETLERAPLSPQGEAGLEIRGSSAGLGRGAGVQADLAPCADCLRELFDPAERRHRYPFLSCTQCGPRFTILERLPYDRLNTTLRGFPLCAACQAEFEDPGDRRFHAQPLACPECGPTLQLWASTGEVLAERDDALRESLTLLREERVLALKGRGGFQLLCRADSPAAVARVRALKRRPEKPLAVMVRDLESARRVCLLEAGVEELLASPAAPIVLARKRGEPTLIDLSGASDLPTLGVMLPATPLHHLLAAGIAVPLVVTSGNRSGEPMPTCERQGLRALGPEVDALLVHDRPIAQVADDSVARWAAGRPLLLRRARGYAPLPVPLGPGYQPEASLLAQGGHLKATLAVSDGARAWVSQHVGDLEAPQARAAYRDVEQGLLEMRGVAPSVAVCDLHPDYASTLHAEGSGRRLIRIQHHEAHVLSVLAEHDVALPALGIAWDGSGYGPDGTVWGGEALLVTGTDCRRLARLRPFPLPGGERAVREPCRAALGLLWALDPNALWEGPGRDRVREAFGSKDRTVLGQALARGLNCPLTSSVGRLFDAVAALTGLCQRSTYEAQAAIALEHAVLRTERGEYRFALDRGRDPWELDWRDAVRALLADVAAGTPVGVIAARLHNGLAAAVATLARESGQHHVVLAGGCFQNRILLETSVARLTAIGCRVDWPCRLPPGDGGLCLGQLAAAARRGE